MRDNLEIAMRQVITDKWMLEVPHTTDSKAPLICIPTIHPRGDQRILRCAQAALNAGYRVKFFWLGEGNPSTDPSAAEEIFPRATSFAQRMLQLPKVALRAHKEQPLGWHIHDLYMLPIALAWRAMTKRLSVYDVHEFYSTYYASKIRAPRLLRNALATLIDAFQFWATNLVGGANVVAAEMSAGYRKRGIPVSVSPNLPLRKYYDASPVSAESRRYRKVIHTGTLSEPYGMKLIIDLAVECQLRGYDVCFDLIHRFPNANQEELFMSYLRGRNQPTNLRLIPAVDADKIASLLSSYGIGLSMISAEGQNDLAIPTKLYEYVLMGLSVVGTERKAQKNFLDHYGVGELRGDSDIEGLADAIGTLSKGESEMTARLRHAAISAREELFWENGPESDLRRLYAEVFPRSS
jgi:glycosyltransferase involved in cell wall biosynthesis